MSPARSLRMAILLIATVGLPARAAVPPWLSGTPDVGRHAERAPLYEAVFEDVTERCGIDVDGTSQARLRLVGAVNAAVKDWMLTRRGRYAAHLPWLSFAEGGPWHCEFRLEGEEIGRVLGVGSDEGARSESARPVAFIDRGQADRSPGRRSAAPKKVRARNVGR